MLRYVTHEIIEEGFQMYCSRFFLMHACACCSLRGSLSTFPLIHLQLQASSRVSIWLLAYVASLHLHSCAFGVHFLHFPSQPLQTSTRFTCEFCTIQHRLHLFHRRNGCCPTIHQTPKTNVRYPRRPHGPRPNKPVLS